MDHTPLPQRTYPWATRTDFGEETHALALAIAAARLQGRPLVDLAVSNPTKCGFAYDIQTIHEELASIQNLVYDADPLGLRAARETVASGYYGLRGASVDADQILITSSTSEAYGYLLRLLCNVGDEILVPQPSYPLFDLLARLHDVRLVPYPLLLHDGWHIDVHALRSAITSRTRVIVLVHPNNPTGHTVDAAERRMVEDLAAEFGLALIVDEVFLDFPVESHDPPGSFAQGPSPVLTFVLSGLSKVLALPQMKLAWTVVCGPEAPRVEALRRLEFIADTFLSPNGPVQHAMTPWMRLISPMQAQIMARTRGNLQALDRLLGVGGMCSRLPVRAGWSVLVRVPATMPDEDFALWLLHHHGLVVHPGSFYGMQARGWLVLSLLVPLQIFAEGIERLISGIAEVIR